jgi:two-component system, OmpR family, response regulator
MRAAACEEQMMSHSAEPARLLLIDDEPSIREPLAEYLVRQGYAVEAVADAAAARIALVDPARFALVISDIMMPGEDGLSLTRHIREAHGLPVILLTARGEEMERVVGLEIGADDYLAKPFSPRELVARIRAVLRRIGEGGARKTADGTATESDATAYRFGTWTFVVEEHALRHDDGRSVPLSAGEHALLLAFVRHPRQVMSRDRLLDMVRGREADLFDRAIDNLVSRLRRKLGDDAGKPSIIKTVWGGGYSLGIDVRKAQPGS